jgi:hypothetical protein
VSRAFRRAALAIMAFVKMGLCLLITFRNSGNFLVVDNREKSDAIVITQGDSLDASFWMGLHLLTDGYGRELLLDARTNRIFFGHSQVACRRPSETCDRIRRCGRPPTPAWPDRRLTRSGPGTTVFAPAIGVTMSPAASPASLCRHRSQPAYTTLSASHGQLRGPC